MVEELLVIHPAVPKKVELRLLNRACWLFSNISSVVEFQRWWFLKSKIFDRSLVEAVQGIALSSSSKTFFVPFAQILEYFIILWFRTSLDMFTYDFKIDKKWYDCIKSHHRHLERVNDLEQVWTCLRIVSNHIISIMTSLDMSENHIKLHH